MRSQYLATVDAFLATSPQTIAGNLLLNGQKRGFAVEQAQVAAWEEQITILKEAFRQ
jgi:hypothetical protein